MMPGALVGGMAAFTVLLVASAVAVLRHVDQQERLALRIAMARGLAPVMRERRSRSPLRVVVRLGTAIAGSGLLPAKTMAELEVTLARAGFRDGNALNLLVGGKLVGLVAGPILAWLFLPEHRLGVLPHHVLCVAAAIGGLLLPDGIVRRLRSSYLASVERGLPDALDMLVICAEAGLSVVPAIARVGLEIRPAHPAVAGELLMTADELHIVSDTRRALNAMGNRTGLASIKRLGTTLIQSQHYGTPLSQALRSLAAEMRGEMLIRFEERAARLPTILTIPMILFILPSMFLVVGGPAMIQVMRTMSR